MSWTKDGTLDPDEALRLLDHMSGQSDNDFVMMIENKGSVVEGESSRAHEDGKQRMDIAGYCLSRGGRDAARVEQGQGAQRAAHRRARNATRRRHRLRAS